MIGAAVVGEALAVDVAEEEAEDAAVEEEAEEASNLQKTKKWQMIHYSQTC